MSTSIADWNTFRRAGDAGRLNVRLMVYLLDDPTSSSRLDPSRHPAPDGVALRRSPARSGRQVLRRRSARLARRLAEAALCRPAGYQWQPQLHSDAELRSLDDKAAARGFQIATHAIGDAANAQVIGTYEWLDRKYGTDRRWRIEHAQIVDLRGPAADRPGRIIASMQPTHQTSDRLMAEKRLGPDRLKCAYAWQSMLRTGARLAFGTDFPVESPNPSRACPPPSAARISTASRPAAGIRRNA